MVAQVLGECNHEKQLICNTPSCAKCYYKELMETPLVSKNTAQKPGYNFELDYHKGALKKVKKGV